MEISSLNLLKMQAQPGGGTLGKGSGPRTRPGPVPASSHPTGAKTAVGLLTVVSKEDGPGSRCDRDAADAVLVGGRAVCCIISALTFCPTPTSSRNCSGSGSCRSMEIWVRAVYVIAASINALLICLGLQSSIRIIHLHAGKTDASRRKNADLLTAGEMERAERRSGSGGQQPERAAASLFVLGLGIVPVLICSTHQQIYIHTTPNPKTQPGSLPRSIYYHFPAER